MRFLGNLDGLDSDRNTAPCRPAEVGRWRRGNLTTGGPKNSSAGFERLMERPVE
jgi:hypothetical protein